MFNEYPIQTFLKRQVNKLASCLSGLMGIMLYLIWQVSKILYI